MVTLENLRKHLLAPRQIVRDKQGFLTHPAMPICDEDVRYADLLAVFGVETALISLEDQDDSLAERYGETSDCSDWEPSPPIGSGWTLLEIFDTESGPYALFGRQALDQSRPPSAHPDDEAVDRFAHAMKEKLAADRKKGRGGWQDKESVSATTLSEMLLSHVFKGDPRDVANFAMFLYERREPITLDDRMEKATQAFLEAEDRCLQQYAAKGVLTDPSIGVEAGLVAAAPHLIRHAHKPSHADGPSSTACDDQEQEAP